mgnify:CR=1 FL=1
MYEMNLERRVDDDDDDMRLVFISRRHYLGTIRYCSLLFFFERIVTLQFFQSAIIL